MSNAYVASPQSMIAMGLFILIYVSFMMKRVLRSEIDLYDLFILSMVAVVPGAFVFFPHLAMFVADELGVAFPFVIMFAALFAIIFIFMHRLTVSAHKSERTCRTLVQELSLLRHEVRQRDGGPK